MNDDFHDHLDAARLWWGLDEAVLEAIAEGPSTRGPYGSIALYVAELKRASAVDEGAEDTASLMKIALRLANTPASAPHRTAPAVRRPVLRAVGLSALVALALAALLTAGAAANVIPVPQPVRDVLRKIGVDTDAAGATQRRPKANDIPHHRHNHLHPIAVQGLPGLAASESSGGTQGAAVAPEPIDSVAPLEPAATPPTQEKGEDEPPKPESTPVPKATEPPDDKRQKDERERRRDEDRRWSRTADDEQ